MRLLATFVAMALIAAIGAIWSASVISAGPPERTSVAPPSTSIDAMQMMKGAKTLPEQHFNMH